VGTCQGEDRERTSKAQKTTGNGQGSMGPLQSEEEGGERTVGKDEKKDLARTLDGEELTSKGTAGKKVKIVD